ncbi:acyltransferase [Pandoraea bronchicola]|uniref:Acetyltransferase n=1 Tax=Pandoraea bronchicola TaxID=2508287 RepID=A0A5E5BV37_9BURK|nr:DapH/DapD/GlmU-related protein [Pandoraea bronchicola]VVE89042.1 Putative acetyltransferase [Pandoraea bronchicola]
MYESGTAVFGPGIHVGHRSVLRIPEGGSLIAGQNVWIGNDCEIGVGARIVIGEGTSIQHRSQLHGDVEIGDGCVFAANFYTSSAQHAFEYAPTLPIRVQDRLAGGRPWAERSRPVSIGNDCWIGINVSVMPGVTIGRGCVIGANSVVTRDIPPYSVAVGSPCRVIRERLMYAPPKMIDATNDAHLPYFYAGVAQRDANAEIGSTVVRVRDGLPANRDFTLALDAASGDAVRLHVDAPCTGTLAHGNQVQPLNPGRSVLTFGAVQTRWQGLAFAWQPANTTDAATRIPALVVTRAEVLPATSA